MDPTEVVLSGIAHPSDDFRSVDGSDLSRRLVHFGGKNYYLKWKPDPLEAHKDALAYRLFGKIANVPEVVVPDRRHHQAFARSFRIPMDWSIHAVRLCHDYRLRDLPIQNMTDAIASDIVCSIWINRWDPHNFNRFFVGDVPMFFDFGTGFASDDPNWDRTIIDNSGAWRLAPVQAGATPDIRELRERQSAEGVVILPVASANEFWRRCGDWCRRIQTFDATQIAEAVGDFFPQADLRQSTTAFLLDARARLAQKLRAVRDVVSQSVYP